ncbi:MAG: hypothetical protein E8D42_07510 [Nitrospira sp.]|nr:MAG: hypothetical protein E8D42_07510 [Nitrospira sp.]
MASCAYPHVPVVTMGVCAGWDPTNIPNGGSLRRLHLLLKPFEFKYIGRLLRSELSAATASSNQPDRESGSPDGRAVAHLSHKRAIHGGTTAWVG